MFLSPEKSFPWEMIGQKEELLFEELKGCLKNIGLPCALILAQTAENSVYAARRHKVPVLYLYAENSEVYRRFIGLPPRMGLLAEDIAKEVRRLWRQLCEQHACNTENYYDKDMYIFLNNIQDTVFTRALRDCKQEIQLFLTQCLQMSVNKIYVNSRPSCNIVFASQEDYRRSSVLFGKAESGIRKIIYNRAEQLFKNDSLEENVLQVVFWHPDMEGYNGYGLARED